MIEKELTLEQYKKFMLKHSYMSEKEISEAYIKALERRRRD